MSDVSGGSVKTLDESQRITELQFDSDEEEMTEQERIYQQQITRMFIQGGMQANSAFTVSRDSINNETTKSFI